MTGRAKWDAWNAASQRDLGWSGDGKQHVEGYEADDDQSHQGGGPTGMGPAVSSMKPPEENADDSLHGLALSGNLTGVKTLLENQPETNLNELDEYGYSPLHLACDRGHFDMVKLLIEKGASTTIKDSDDLTAHELAQVAERTDIVEFLGSVAKA